MAAQDIINAYQAKLGRAPGARELESEIENDSKYGHDRLLRELDTRAAPTFSGGGSGGDADLDGNRQADAGWVQATPGRGRSWVRPGDRGAMGLSDLAMAGTPMDKGRMPGPSYGNDYRGIPMPLGTGQEDIPDWYAQIVEGIKGTTSDPTRFWPIDPATGLKRPPRRGDPPPRFEGPTAPVSTTMPVDPRASAVPTLYELAQRGLI